MILIIAILPIVTGLVIMANIMYGPSVVPVTTPATPTATTIPISPTQTMPTPVATEAITPGPPPVVIPPIGVWVRASYPGSYIGLIGTARENQSEVSGTGDKFYPISTIDGSAPQRLQKKDGSGDKIILEVYKNGVMLKRESTVTPRGIVEIQIGFENSGGSQ